MSEMALEKSLTNLAHGTYEGQKCVNVSSRAIGGGFIINCIQYAPRNPSIEALMRTQRCLLKKERAGVVKARTDEGQNKV